MNKYQNALDHIKAQVVDASADGITTPKTVQDFNSSDIDLLQMLVDENEFSLTAEEIRAILICMNHYLREENRNKNGNNSINHINIGRSGILYSKLLLCLVKEGEEKC